LVFTNNNQLKEEKATSFFKYFYFLILSTIFIISFSSIVPLNVYENSSSCHTKILTLLFELKSAFCPFIVIFLTEAFSVSIPIELVISLNQGDGSLDFLLRSVIIHRLLIYLQDSAHWQENVTKKERPHLSHLRIISIRRTLSSPYSNSFLSLEFFRIFTSILLPPVAISISAACSFALISSLVNSLMPPLPSWYLTLGLLLLMTMHLHFLNNLSPLTDFVQNNLLQSSKQHHPNPDLQYNLL